MRIDTNQDLERAIDRLTRRDSKSLATFIVSLAQDTGPVGEQVRTFIIGDDVKETVASIGARIRDLRSPTESENRGQLGQEIGERLEFILESIETLVLPVDPKAAFKLLVKVFEADAVAMENCEDHDFEVGSGFERAAELIGRAAESLPQAEVVAALEALLDDDGYGVRGALAEVIASRRGDR
jgi:hypothetical protein